MIQPLAPDEVAARVKAWKDGGDPRSLWPHVSSDARRRAHQHIATATRAVLAGENGAHLKAPDGADAVGIAAFSAGMGAMLGYWLEQGVLVADDDVVELLKLHLEHGRRRATALQSALARILAACGERRVSPIVLKGSHTGGEYFPEPGVRTATDIDLLTHPRDIIAMRSALEAAGFYESRHTTHPQRSEWTPRGVAQRVTSLDFDHADNPWSVDLHTRLERTYFRGASAGFGARPFDEAVPRSFEGQPARVLAQPLLSAYLAQNASYGIDELRLVKIVELVLVLRRDSANGSLDWRDLAETISETGTARFVYPAYKLAECLAPGTVPADLLATLSLFATRGMHKVIAEADAHGMHLPRRSIEEKLMWSQGPAEVLRNVLDLIAPQSAGFP